MTHPWFDAHLDLACLAVNGRDLAAPLDSCAGPWLPAAVTLPSLREGQVVAALATIFTESGGKDAEAYPAGDAEAAHARGRAQLEVYHSLRDRGLISIDLPRALRTDNHVGALRAGMGVSEVIPTPASDRLARSSTLHVGILMECADPIRTPDELSWWAEHGVIAIGLAWARGSRYAGGNTQSGVGLTPLGCELVRAMDGRGVVHDLAHLSQRATEELLELTDRPVIASHCNCRALLPGDNERHLADSTNREVARRAGVIGVNLVSNFLDPEARETPPRRARFETIFAHIERICELTGSRSHVALGSDMDGGFSANWLPEGVNAPRDLAKISAELSRRAWTDDDIAGFRFHNWARFFSSPLPLGEVGRAAAG